MEPKNLLERLERMIHIAHETNCILTKIATPDAEKILELLSDPEWVRVVRCRDCKHSKRMCQPWNDLVCNKHGGANMPGWFCADGERGE